MAAYPGCPGKEIVKETVKWEFVMFVEHHAENNSQSIEIYLSVEKCNSKNCSDLHHESEICQSWRVYSTTWLKKETYKFQIHTNKYCIN